MSGSVVLADELSGTGLVAGSVEPFSGGIVSNPLPSVYGCNPFLSFVERELSTADR